MMMAARSGTVVAILIVLNGLLLAVLSYEWLSLGFDVKKVAVAREPAALELHMQNPGPLSNHSLADYEAVSRRPLFNKDRLPLAQSDADDEVDVGLTLVGVVLTPEQQVAIIYSDSQQQPVKVARRDWIEGWRLIAIEPQGVVLRKGNRTLEMALQRNSQAESELSAREKAKR